jgi:hypothetical protein
VLESVSTLSAFSLLCLRKHLALLNPPQLRRLRMMVVFPAPSIPQNATIMGRSHARMVMMR